MHIQDAAALCTELRAVNENLDVIAQQLTRIADSLESKPQAQAVGGAFDGAEDYAGYEPQPLAETHGCMYPDTGMCNGCCNAVGCHDFEKYGPDWSSVPGQDDEVEMHKCTQPERRGYDSNNYCGCDHCPDKENCNDEIPF